MGCAALPRQGQATGPGQWVSLFQTKEDRLVAGNQVKVGDD